MIPTILETYALVDRLFAGKTDEAGRPYVDHCVRVMALLPADATDDERHAALLHYVFEDTDATLTYPTKIIQLVTALTRRHDEYYEDYISRVAKNPSARRIKIADLTDNTDPARVRILPPETRRRLERKYRRAWDIIRAH